MSKSKELFFKNEYVPLLKKLKGDEKGNWGVLSPQGMIEHMSESIAVSSMRIVHALHTPPEMVAKMKSFALSDKEFRPGTKNALMSDDAAPLRNKNIQEAIAELELEIKEFLDFYEHKPEQTVTNPFFGDLNYEEWLQLLHKHAIHHLKQFNLI
jgi:DinB superfamily